MRSAPPRSRVAQPSVVIESRDNAVVDQEPVLRTHEAVAALSGLQRGHHVRVEHVQQPAGVRALHDNLAQRGGIKKPDP